MSSSSGSSPMDYFKPLYKRHKNEKPMEAFDPAAVNSDCAVVGGYTLRKLKSSIDGLRQAYAAYNLEAPSEAEVEEWTCEDLPGLRVFPGLITPDLQARLVTDAATTYLTSTKHRTNLDNHFEVPRPIPVDKFIEYTNSKPPLRWVTLGGQYNWTTKEYPSWAVGEEGCPEFPPQLTEFIRAAFAIDPQAAIVNYYSPGDTLSPHQDVAERSDADLVSISLGCPCVFYIGAERFGCQPMCVTLQSGDVLLMSGASRRAFHGVGRVWGPPPDTLRAKLAPPLCNWISTKRININVRQMLDTDRFNRAQSA